MKKQHNKFPKNEPDLVEWRICPLGYHWVSPHTRHIKTNQGSKTISVKGHCACNSSKKDQLYKNEIQIIADNFFKQLQGPPTRKISEFGDKSNKYDSFIRGWVKYWNSILKPDIPLDANIIKALIASESGFNKDAFIKINKKNSAHGLMQVTNETLIILADEKGELKDHLINLTLKDLYDSNANICAAVRWLFWKRERASARLKRKATWIEGVAHYKAYLNKLISDPKFTKMDKFFEYLEELKK